MTRYARSRRGELPVSSPQFHELLSGPPRTPWSVDNDHGTYRRGERLYLGNAPFSLCTSRCTPPFDHDALCPSCFDSEVERLEAFEANARQIAELLEGCTPGTRAWAWWRYEQHTDPPADEVGTLLALGELSSTEHVRINAAADWGPRPKARADRLKDLHHG